jgi:hypothetical protein
MPFDRTNPEYFTRELFNLGGTNAIRVPSGTTAQRPGVAIADSGMIRFNATTGGLETYHLGTWNPIRIPGTATITKDTDTGDGSTTAFNMLSSTPASDQSVLIFINNVFQEAGTAYTTSGTTVTFTSAPPNTHVIVALSGFDTV